MEDHSFVKLLITEDVYLHPNDISHYQSTEEPPAEETPAAPVTTTVESHASEDQESVEVSPTPEEQPQPTITETAEAEKEVPGYSPPVYEGFYVKKVLVVVHSAGPDFAHKDLLMKILGAIGLTKEDVAILPSKHISSKEDFDWMVESQKSSLIAFGLPDKWKDRIAADHTLYEVRKHHGYQLLFSENLTSIAENVDSKRKLWAALQKL